MIVRKLRLKKGWSQETLAELTGLSVRTIQRVERGHKVSLETARSLASVFQVDLSTFQQGVPNMNTQNNTQETLNSQHDIKVETLKGDEKEALEYVKGIKEFYTHAFIFLVFALSFYIIKPDTKIELFWPFVGWGFGVIAHGIMAYELISFPWQNWEKKMIEKKIGRKL